MGSIVSLLFIIVFWFHGFGFSWIVGEKPQNHNAGTTIVSTSTSTASESILSSRSWDTIKIRIRVITFATTTKTTRRTWICKR